MSDTDIQQNYECSIHDHDNPCPFCLNEKDEELRIKRLAELECKNTSLRKEVERLSGKTGYCLQCEKYAKEVERLRGALEKIGNYIDRGFSSENPLDECQKIAEQALSGRHGR